MIQENLKKQKIIPDPLKDQFFLTNPQIIKRMIDFANLRKTDVVLEIGAGTGNLTEEIAKKAGRVISFEIDSRFKQFLMKLPKNVEMHYENAWNYVQLRGKFKKRKEYNKVVANPPYSFIEPFVHNLTFLTYDKVILLVPLRFLKKTEKWGIFGSFFEPKVLLKVPKENFYPMPKTDSVVISLVKLPDPIETKNVGRFLRQYIYSHEGQLVKNSLVEGLIKYQKLAELKFLSKNESRKIIEDKNIPLSLLDKKPQGSEIYELIGSIFNST